MKAKRLIFFALLSVLIVLTGKVFLMFGPLGRCLMAAFLVNQLAMSSTTVYMHRSETHPGVKFKSALEVVLRFFFWITTGQTKFVWVPVHRRHHKYTDQEASLRMSILGDPHSPVVESWAAIQFGNVPRYRRAGRDPETLRKFSHGLVEDKLDRILFNHGVTGLLIGITTLCLILGFWWGLLAGLLHTLFYILLETSSVNAICHTRWFPLNYQIKPIVGHAITVFNNLVVAILTWGEGLHYWHHEQQDSAKFARLWWEPDLGWYFILMCESLGWTTKVRRPHSLHAVAA